MTRIVKLAVGLALFASPVLADDGRFDLDCHGTHTLSRGQARTARAVSFSMSVNLDERQICERPCKYQGSITSVTPREITAKGLKSTAAALDEVRSYARDTIADDAPTYDTQHSELTWSRASGRLVWRTPIKLRSKDHPLDESVIEAICRRAPFTGKR